MPVGIVAGYQLTPGYTDSLNGVAGTVHAANYRIWVERAGKADAVYDSATSTLPNSATTLSSLVGQKVNYEISTEPTIRIVTLNADQTVPMG